MTEPNKQLLQDYINAITDGGTTNFGAALGLTMDIFEKSSGASASSGCQRVVLFMSDGEPSQGTWESSDADSILSRAQALSPSPHILTYAFGAGADSSALKGISCAHQGVHYTISDGGNIADVMAGYYKVLSPMGSPCKVREEQRGAARSSEEQRGAARSSEKQREAARSSDAREGQGEIETETETQSERERTTARGRREAL